MDISKEMEWIAGAAKAHLKDFKGGFPFEQSENHRYKAITYDSWTEGFYPGILWILYEMTQDSAFYDAAKARYPYFKERIEQRRATDHHDLGFLYSLSCVAQFKVTNNSYARETAILAAEELMKRFQPLGGFIQAWGGMDDPNAYRLIVDCLLNIPLLFWAAEETGEKRFYDAAACHMKAACKNVIRKDSSTFHTFYFDPQTGAPLYGATHQGYADDSCWARGQAWAIYGTALCYRYTKEESLIQDFIRVTRYFISHLPKDKIPYWDLCFDDTSGMPRDTSAAAIAVCGILEMGHYTAIPEFTQTAGKMMESLAEKYTAKQIPESNGFLTDGMYNYNNGDRPECNIWGDYFYTEALMRYHNPQWKGYW